MRKGLDKAAIAFGMLGIGLVVVAALAGSSPAPGTTGAPADHEVRAAGPPANAASTRASDAEQPRPIEPRQARRAPAPSEATSSTASTRDATHETPEPPVETSLRERLERAIARAETERDFTIHPAVVDTVLDRGDVRILFPIDVDHHARARNLLARPDGPTDLRFFPLLGQGAARVDGDRLVALIESGLLASIDLDVIHRPSLAATIPLIRADEAHRAGDDGTGRAIAILDTGIDTSHEMFAGRVAEEACFSLLASCPDASRAMVGRGAAVPCSGSGCGHGTSVAGIAAGHAADDRLVGVAPAAQLIAIQVFSELGGGDIGAYTSDIVAGLQHVLGLGMTYDVDAVNLSVGGTIFGSVAACEAGSSSASAAIATLRDAGIVTVAAGGNDGRVDAITSPACLTDVIGVGATNAADLVPGYSNSTDLLTMLAPGAGVESAANGGGTSLVGGTSMAAPHVSGAIALLRQHHPAATPAEIENALVLAGVPIHDPRGDVTLPRLDVQGAIDLLSTAAAAGAGGSATPTPSAVSDGGGGAACGLIGLEPFLAVGAVRLLGRRRRLVPRGTVGAARCPLP